MLRGGRIQPALNPHQRQFLQDEIRTSKKLQRLQRDSINSAGVYTRRKSAVNDPRLLDYRDSFYKTTKSLLTMFQLMGVMPIMRNPPIPGLERTAFKWSKVFAWAVFVYSLELVIVIIVGYDRIKNYLDHPSKKLDEVIHNIIFLSILLPHLLLPMASWRHGPQVAIFKNMWTNYQWKYLTVTGTPIEFPNLYVLTWWFCIVSWLVSLIVVLPQYFLQNDFQFWHTFAYYHIIAMLNGFCSLWYVNCNAFGFASRALRKSLQGAFEQSQPAEKLMEYRHLWVDLSHMMQQLGRAYSNMYGIYCLVIFFTTIIATYGALSEIIDNGATYKEFGLFVIVLYCMSLLFIICNEAYYATKSVGLDFQTILLNINLRAFDNPVQKEVEMFLVAIAKNPPTMNLNGYVNINRQLITSNISVMVTYLVVLLQFKLSLLRKSQLEAVTQTKVTANTTLSLKFINSDGLYKRRESVIDDPFLLELHDSFYHTTRSLLVMFQIMGIMPIQRNPCVPGLPRTSFKWSKYFAWAIFIYTLELFYVLVDAFDRVRNFVNSSEKRFDEIIYNVLFLSLLLPHVPLPVASWPNGPEAAIFKNMWTNYQVKFLKVTGHPIIFPNLYVLTWTLCIASWIVSFLVILPQYYLQDDFLFWHTFAYYHILAMLNGFCSLWYVNCNAFGFTSRLLSKCLEDTLQQPNSSDKLTDYRHIWVDLSHMMQQLRKAYSNMYGIYCLIIFFTTIIATYGAFSEIIDHGVSLKEAGLLLIATYCMSLLFIICNEAHYASKSVGLDFHDRLLNVNSTSVDNSTQKEVEMFLMAIEKNPPTMNLNGYPNINRNC